MVPQVHLVHQEQQEEVVPQVHLVLQVLVVYLHQQVLVVTYLEYSHVLQFMLHLLILFKVLT
jgi:hypothetical protein